MEQLTPLLQELAKSLGTTVENLWRILLQQTIVEKQITTIYMNISLWTGIILIGIGILLIIWGLIRNYKDGFGENGVVTGCTGVIIIVFALLIFGSLYWHYYTTLITLNNNPEYWALQEILSRIP
jgi:protein-S-isoprenylcysteine O-methyltransferase Ste14